MGIRSSYSQNQTYSICSMKWKHEYIDKWKSPIEGASLSFGSAIDTAVMAMLEGKENWLQIFYDNWTTSFNFGERKQVFDNPNISFAHKDFDYIMLESKDYLTLEQWAVELKLKEKDSVLSNKELIDLYKECSEIKKNPYKHLTKEQLTYFNRASWLSMKRKGKLLLNSFKDQFLPKIKKVHFTQKRGTIKDDFTGDSISGFIDLIADIEGFDETLVIDLKTSGQPYTEEDLKQTQQLALYSEMSKEWFPGGLKNVGYLVLCKNIPKEVIYTCKSCGNKKNGKHKTCNAEINSKRCNGEWNEIITPKPEVQFLTIKKTQEEINEVLLDSSNIMFGMENKVIFKNTGRCNDIYGAPCPFKKSCWDKDFTGLVKK